jgi:uncharacterized protein (DUF952 family)
MIYHLTTEQAWRAAKRAGSYQAGGAPYVACRRRRQLPDAYARMQGTEGVVLLCINETFVSGDIRLEEEGGVSVPRIYGGLPLDAVIAVVRSDDEAFSHFVAPSGDGEVHSSP